MILRSQVLFPKTFCDFLCLFAETISLEKYTDYGRPMKLFCIEIQKFWTWADEFWGIWGIFGQTISTHFGTVSHFSMFSIIQPLFLQKSKPLYPHPKYLFGIGI